MSESKQHLNLESIRTLLRESEVCRDYARRHKFAAWEHSYEMRIMSLRGLEMQYGGGREQDSGLIG